MVLDDLRAACSEVAGLSRHVRVEHEAIPGYAAALARAVAEQAERPPDAEAELLGADRETTTAFWLCLDAVNFGSGWFPTLIKRPGRSGYFAVAIPLREWFAQRGAPAAATLGEIDAARVAQIFGQPPDHPLMELFAVSLRDLGQRVAVEYDGAFSAVLDGARDSAVALVEQLAGWSCFSDASAYGHLLVPFLKRAQLAAADLARSGAATFPDLPQLTAFADNLVPHVLCVDGLLTLSDDLSTRIRRGELLEHGSPEEVELRACAVHAVELIAGELPGAAAADLDLTLWNRGQAPRYRGIPRPRCRCTAY
jgi:hypothetical protein